VFAKTCLPFLLFFFFPTLVSFILSVFLFCKRHQHCHQFVLIAQEVFSSCSFYIFKASFSFPIETLTNKQTKSLVIIETSVREQFQHIVFYPFSDSFPPGHRGSSVGFFHSLLAWFSGLAMLQSQEFALDASVVLFFFLKGFLYCIYLFFLWVLYRGP